MKDVSLVMPSEVFWCPSVVENRELRKPDSELASSVDPRMFCRGALEFRGRIVVDRSALKGAKKLQKAGSLAEQDGTPVRIFPWWPRSRVAWDVGSFGVLAAPVFQ